MRRRSVSALAAAALVCSLLPSARAASSPSLDWEDGEKRGEIFLTLQDLDGSGVYAAQLELTLEGSWPDVEFTPGGRELYSVCQSPAEGGVTYLTVCLTSRNEPLASGEQLFLGTLDLGGRGTGEDVLPASAQLTLLDRGLNRMEEMSGKIKILGDVGSSGPAGSSGGSSGKGDKKDPDKTPPAQKEPAGPPAETAPMVIPLPFLDVEEGDWYCGAVRYVFEQSLMNGVTADRFGPDEPATRGMIVTILHRMEGSPEAPDPSFPDVRAEDYYAQPVTWAEAHGVVTGYEDGTFGPENPITREQLAAILFRFARYKGWDMTASASLERFPDREKISPYALEAVSWAVGEGLISGMANGMLSPGGTATRAEIATILMRLEAVRQHA